MDEISRLSSLLLPYSQASAPIEPPGLELGNSLRREAGGGGPEAEDETRFHVLKLRQARG